MLGQFRRPMQLSRCPLSLRRPSGEQVPSPTAQIARASNPGGTTAVWVRDRLDGGHDPRGGALGALTPQCPQCSPQRLNGPRSAPQPPPTSP
ncbi:hypothetical protein DDV98_01920 [Streptomyces sp. IB2014 011-12]|nr:hypothetical protein DDV98_01920 [Streptomyces sp. IB2014 011-12]